MKSPILSTPYHVEPVITDAGVAELREAWDRLSAEAAMPNVFTTYDWFRTWSRQFGCKDGGERLRAHVLAIRQAGRLAGVAPLIQATARRGGVAFRRLQFALQSEEWDYNDLVVGDHAEAQMKAVAAHLAQTAEGWELVDLRELRDVDRAREKLERALAWAGLSYRAWPELERNPFMMISNPWSESIQQHSRSMRRVFRRFTRLLGKGLRVRVVEEPHNEPGLLERLIAVEAQKQVNGVLSEPFLGRYAEAFRTLFAQLGPQGWIRVVLLEWEDRLIAWQLLFKCGTKLWGYLTAYDNGFTHLSPGTMLIPVALDYGLAHGCNEFDFLRGEEAYKMRWATDFHRTWRIAIWNRRLKSRLYAAAYRRMRTGPHAGEVA